jgi:hypothetical protein
VPYTTRGAQVKVSFAKDLGVRCKKETVHYTVLTGIRLTERFLAEEHRRDQRHELSAESDHAEPVDVIFELTRAHNASVSKEHATPFEETASFRRFRLTVPPHGKASMKVVEQVMGQQRIEYASLSLMQVAKWLEGRFLDTETEKTLSAVVAAQTEALNIDQRRMSVEQAVTEGYAKLSKLTEQLRVLKEGGAEGELRLRYVRELEGEQDRVNAFANEIVVLRGQAEAARKRADAALHAAARASVEEDGPTTARK